MLAACLVFHKEETALWTERNLRHSQVYYTRMHGVSAHTGFPRTLTITNYISAVFSTLNPILSVTNLSRLECAETSCIRVQYET